MTSAPNPGEAVPGIPASGLDSTPSGWAGAESGSSPWLLGYDGYDPAVEGLREALCTLGNGDWATRGAAPEADADVVHYPGTYLAGVYNRVRQLCHGVPFAQPGEDRRKFGRLSTARSAGVDSPQSLDSCGSEPVLGLARGDRCSRWGGRGRTVHSWLPS
ncbi:hypothetical protein [Pseudarthrobacter sp. ATCC 49987]|uniref:hypothetical protein n=1 Tax=Pseudarthrobacter sp. ATCC 49987 TaxID=2698204 RepID=UPI003FCDF663